MLKLFMHTARIQLLHTQTSKSGRRPCCPAAPCPHPRSSAMVTSAMHMPLWLRGAVGP